MSPFFIQAGTNTVSANDKIGIGLIGCNGMGFSDLQAFLRNPEVECVALADVDEGVLNKRAADVEKLTGKKVKHLYKDWRKLIDNKHVDLVIVGTPDHWHCLQMVAACEAGKDVYCEKPLGNSIEELAGRRSLCTQRKAGQASHRAGILLSRLVPLDSRQAR